MFTQITIKATIEIEHSDDDIITMQEAQNIVDAINREEDEIHNAHVTEVICSPISISEK